ncbi:MAG TPA: DUF4230 domain-containing protein [Dongiaceae bacterium]|nr:DUF4230 domain-containing protein [Dongiaceae bacterium]
MKRLRIILILFFLLAVFLLGFWLGWQMPRGGAHSKTYPTAILLQQVQTLSELVTVKYVLEKTEVLEDVKWSEWLGTSRVLLLAHGVVKAGVDLKRMQPNDIRISGKKVVIVLPPAQIIDAYLDEKQTQVIERTTGIIRSFDKTLETTARQEALADIERAARHNGILKDADDRAKTQLAGLFHQLGYDSVVFESSMPVLLPPEAPAQP